MRPVAGIVILAEFFQAWNIEKFLEQHWEDNQTKSSSREVLQEVKEVFGRVTENLPELSDGEDADIEDDKEADELDRNGT